MKDRYGVEAQNLPAPQEVEIWLPAPGFEDRYEVSSFGNVRYKKTKQLRTITYDNSGYPTINLKINNKSYCVYIHRLVCQAFYGPPAEDKNICDHRDRCIINNYYKNLHWVNSHENRVNRKVATYVGIDIKNTPIVFLDPNGKFIRKFKSIAEASEILQMSVNQINLNVRGRRKPFQNGFFKTEKEYNAMSIDK